MQASIKTNKYLQSRKHHMRMCHPDDKGSKCKTIDYSDIERIPITNITGSLSAKRGFRAKVNQYTDDEIKNSAEVRELFKRESGQDEYDPWASISPIGNGYCRRKLLYALSLQLM